MHPVRTSSALLLVIACACVNDAVPELPEDVAARCRYENRFAGQYECRDYLGPWDLDDASEDCVGWGGALEAGERCDANGA